MNLKTSLKLFVLTLIIFTFVPKTPIFADQNQKNFKINLKITDIPDHSVEFVVKATVVDFFGLSKISSAGYWRERTSLGLNPDHRKYVGGVSVDGESRELQIETTLPQIGDLTTPLVEIKIEARPRKVDGESVSYMDAMVKTVTFYFGDENNKKKEVIINYSLEPLVPPIEIGDDTDDMDSAINEVLEPEIHHIDPLDSPSTDTMP